MENKPPVIPPFYPEEKRCQFCIHSDPIDAFNHVGTCNLTNDQVHLDFYVCDKFEGNACDCHKCAKERGRGTSLMVLCRTCGNKRCPKASDHTLECTGSNDSGQKGSIYEFLC